MIIKLHSLISILLITILVFHYSISNIVYATEDSIQSSQEHGTSKTEEQPAEEIIETPKNVNQEQTEEQQETTTEVTQTESTEVEQTTTQDEEDNEADELSTEETTTEVTQTESTETQEENEDTTQSADQQESDNSNEGSTGSLSQQEFLNTSVADTEAPYIVNVEKTDSNQITFTFNEPLQERTSTTTDHWGLTTYETYLGSSDNNGLRTVGSVIVGNKATLEYSPTVSGSGFYYYVPPTTDPIVDLAGNPLAEITAANKLPFYLPDHTVAITNGPTNSLGVIQATFTDLPISTEEIRSRLSQLKIKSTSNISIRGANGYGLSSTSKIRLKSVDVNDPAYNFKNLKTLQFEYNDNTTIAKSDSLFLFSSSTQKTGRITIRQRDGYNASLAIFIDETTRDIVCVKNIFSSLYGGTLSSGWRKYHIKILDTGWEFYVGNNKKTTYDCNDLTTEKLLTSMPLDLKLDDIYLFSSPDGNNDAQPGWVRNIYLADHDIPVSQTDHNGESFIFSHLGETTSVTDVSDPVVTYTRYSPYPYELYSYSKDTFLGATTDVVKTYIESAPVIDLESISISSDNIYTNGQHATIDDTISLEFTATSTPFSDPVVLIGGQTPVRDTTVSAPNFKYTLAVDANTVDGTGSEILSITLVNDFKESNSPDLSALTFSIIKHTPVIITSTVNIGYSLTKVSAASDIPATMHQKQISTFSTCDAAEMSTGTTLYTSGTDLSYTDDADNGFRVCFSAVTAVGKSTYKVAGPITGLDTNPPTVTISTPTTDLEQSKTFSATATDTTETTWIYKVLTSDSVCEEASLTTDTISYTEGDDIVFSSESDNGNILCFKVTDEAGFISYESATVSGIDTTVPTVSIKTQVSTPTKNPSIQISSTEAGTVVFSGDCGVANAIQITNPLQGESETLLDIDLKNVNGGDFVDGTYNCTVAVTDAASNTSTYLTIDTFVVDNTNPTFTTVKIYSNYSTNNAYAKQGDIISIDIIASEALTEIPVFSSFTIGGTSVTSVPTFSINTNTPNAYFTTYTVLESDSGVVAFSFIGTDETKNPSAAITQTTDGSSVIVDNSALSFPLVEISSNNTNTSFAKQGEIITITVESSGALSGAPTFSSFTIGGTAVTLPTFADDENSTTTNTYVTTHTVTSTNNGLVEFSFTGTNLAGTTSDAIITTTNRSSVTADTTNPEDPTETTSISTPTNDNTPTVIVSVKEDGTFSFGGSCATYKPDNISATNGDNSITFKTMPVGAYSDCTIKLTDLAGNESTALTLSAFTIDTSTTDTPTITTAIPTLVNDNTPTVIVNVTKGGTFIFGGSCQNYAPDDTSATSGDNSITFKTMTDGTYDDCSIKLRSIAGTESTALTLSTFTVDVTAPTFSSVLLSSSDSSNNPYAKVGEAITLTVKASETLSAAPTFSSFTIGGTAVTLPTFADDENSTTTNTYIATYTVQQGENGTLSFSFTGTDLINNTSAAVTRNTNSSVVTVDTSNPKTESISLDTAGTQTTTFDVRVSFTEVANNVGISNFEFTDGTSSVAEIIKVELHSNSNFNNTNSSTTTNTTTLSGRYFKVSIKPNEDINNAYTFKVLPGSITDDATNTFETSSNDTLSVTVNTERAPTLTSLSIVNPSVTPKTGDFEVDVIFSESVNGVDIDDFRFVRTGTVNLKGSITKVEAFDETFTTSTGSLTTDTTTISGQYFRVSVHPKNALRTNENGTPSVTYTFEILSSGSITDGASNAFDSTSGIATTLDVAVDTLDPLIINTEIINNKLVLTSSLSLNDVTVTGTGGFTVTGKDGTAYTISGVVVNDVTITISFTSGTTPTDRGTYTYTKVSSLTIQTSSSNRLSNIASTTYGPDFTLDLDSSGDYTASKDGLFLYLYTQTAYTLNDTALSQLIDSNSSLVDTKAKINDGINDDSLDLDSSGDYTASKDGLFLYLYTQTAYSLNDTALSQLIDSSSSLQGTKDNIAKFLP